MAEALRVGVIQLNSRSDVAANVERARDLVGQAAADGARLVATPEYTTYLGPRSGLRAAATAVPGSGLAPFVEAARQHAIWLLVGVVEAGAPGDRCWNTSVFLGPDGSVVARYRKLHLFDVEVGPVHELESAAIAPGDEVVTAEVAGLRLGLSICYDVRFPELYRALVDRGAEVLAIPAAFTAHTGAAHWETLVRARAIESQAFVLAPAQWGAHEGGACHGQSLILGPWGETLAELPREGDGCAVADLDPERLRQVRRDLPALAHRRLPLEAMAPPS